jgi:hypothetical protein
MMGTELVPETLIFNELTQLIVREDFINFSCHESFKSYNCHGVSVNCPHLYYSNP